HSAARHFQDFAVHERVQPPGDAVLRNLLQRFQDIAVAANPQTPLGAAEEVAPGAARERAEIATKTQRRIVTKRPHLLSQVQQDVLRYVLGVGILQLPLPAPTVDPMSVALDEFPPDGRLIGGLGKSAQKSLAGARVLVVAHHTFSCGTRNLARDSPRRSGKRG